jgi:hypothetical protein
MQTRHEIIAVAVEHDFEVSAFDVVMPWDAGLESHHLVVVGQTAAGRRRGGGKFSGGGGGGERLPLITLQHERRGRGRSMDENESSGAEAPPPQQPPAKLPYNTPVLTVYGSVRQLTQGASGPNNGDGLGMNMTLEG